MTKATRDKVRALYYEGVAIWQIAKTLNITEYQVVKILGLR